MQAVPEIHEESDELRFGSFNGKALSFWLNLSIKPVKNFFVYKCKLSLAFLYLVMFIRKLKTRFSNLFLLNDFKYNKNSQLLLKKFPRKS